MFIALFISTLFFLPRFFDITKYNEVISSQIEMKTGLYVKAKGTTNFSILPKVRVHLQDITINISDKDDESKLIKVGDGKGLFFEISLANLIKGKFNSIDRIVLRGADLDLTSFTKEEKEYVGELLNEKLEFNRADTTVYLEKSKIKFPVLDKNREIENLDAKINVSGRKVSLLGGGTHNNLEFDIDSTVILKDIYNISGEGDVFYKSKKLDYGVNYKFNKDYNNILVKGGFYFKKIKNDKFENILSEDLISKLHELNSREKAKLSGGFQYSNGSFRIEDAKLDYGATNGKINYYYNKGAKRHSLDLDMKNIYIEEGSEGDIRSSLLEFFKEYDNFYMNSKIRFLHLSKDNGLINDLEFKINNVGGVNIKDLHFKSPQFKSFSFDGVLSEGDIEGKVEFSPGHGFSSDFIRKLDFKSLKGNMIYDFDEIQLYDTIFLLGSDVAEGDVSINKDGVEISVLSSNLSLDHVCKGNLLDCISQNVNLYNNNKEIFFRGIFEKVSYNSNDYNDINMNISLNGDRLVVNNLTFSDKDNSVKVDGVIKGLDGNSKKLFDNLFFDVDVKNFSRFKLYNLSLPFLQNVLKEKSGNIKMNVDGPVIGPTIDIIGLGDGIEFSLNSVMSNRSASNIDMNFVIDDFKEFLRNYDLKSSALKNINTNLVKDSVSLDMKVSLDSKTGYISNIGLLKGDSNLNLDISFEGDVPVINISSDTLNLGDFIKKSSTAYKSDILVYAINSFGGDLSLKLNRVLDYDDEYKNLSISRHIDDGLLKFSYFKNKNSEFTLDGYYDVNTGFDGNIFINTYIKDRMFNSEDLDIVGSNIDIRAEVKFFGKKYDEIIANLSSNFEMKITGGNIIGLSSKDQIQKILSSEERMTYSLLDRFLSDLPLSGMADIKSIVVYGNILDGELNECSLEGDFHNILVSGNLLGDLKAKMIGFNGDYTINNFYDSYSILGNLSLGGFLKGKINKELEINSNVKEIPIVRMKNFYN
jgi:hypothetical protein